MNCYFSVNCLVLIICFSLVNSFLSLSCYLLLSCHPSSSCHPSLTSHSSLSCYLSLMSGCSLRTKYPRQDLGEPFWVVFLPVIVRLMGILVCGSTLRFERGRAEGTGVVLSSRKVREYCWTRCYPSSYGL